MQTPHLQRLQDELFRQGNDGFRRLQAAYPTHTFYSFAFYTCGEFSYLVLTASTFEGLDSVAAKYKQFPQYSSMSIDDLRLVLKWSPCDSPLHEAADDALDALSPLMNEVTAELDRRADLEDDGQSVDEFVSELKSCFAAAIQRMDAEGTFGQETNRANVVVNLLMGDQSDEDRLEFAERVNPPDAVEAFRQDLEAADRLRQ